METTKTESAENSQPYRRLFIPRPFLRAPELAGNNAEMKQLYWDRSHYDSHQAQIAALVKSSTLYVGNLSFSTTSRLVRAHFNQIGPTRTVHMGLDRIKKTPCGFCFVEYHERKHALQAVSALSGTKLDGNIIRVELDAGFQQGRQYGRGVKGGQTRHDRKQYSSYGGDSAGQKRGRGPSFSNPAPSDNAAPGSVEGDQQQQQQSELGDNPPTEAAEAAAETGDDSYDNDQPAKRQRTEE